MANTPKKMKFSTKDFFSKYDQIRSFLQILSHLLKKSLTKNFTFGSVERLTLTKEDGNMIKCYAWNGTEESETRIKKGLKKVRLA